MTKRRILVTGATGNVGWPLTQALFEHYDVIATGREAKNAEQAEHVTLVDINDLERLTALLDGVDTVLHLAATASPQSEWDAVLEANLIGTRSVLEASRLAGVRRVVFASSNHVMGIYDRLSQWPVQSDQLPRGDSLYGVSKIFGEALGRYYHDEYGIDFISLRIGWVAEDPMEREKELLHAMWLSPRDCVQVFRCAIEAPAKFGLYYAISDNPNRRWDTTNTQLELGYRPVDSWTRFTGQVEDVVPGGVTNALDWPANS